MPENPRSKMPSRPGEFHPEPLTNSAREPLDRSGSCHRMKAASVRHCSGSLALASLDRACWNLVDVSATFTTIALAIAACGGLRSAPDCQTRRALLHLSYSCAPPVLMAVFVTHDPQRI